MTVKIKNSSSPKVLTTKEERVIFHLTLNKTYRSAAEAAGVRAATVSAMMRRPHFVEALRRARAESRRDALVKLECLLNKAVEVIDDSLSASDSALQFRTASYYLDRMVFARAKNETGREHNNLKMQGLAGVTLSHSMQNPSLVEEVEKTLRELDEGVPDDDSNP